MPGVRHTGEAVMGGNGASLWGGRAMESTGNASAAPTCYPSPTALLLLHLPPLEASAAPLVCFAPASLARVRGPHSEELLQGLLGTRAGTSRGGAWGIGTCSPIPGLLSLRTPGSAFPCRQHRCQVCSSRHWCSPVPGGNWRKKHFHGAHIHHSARAVLPGRFLQGLG